MIRTFLILLSLFSMIGATEAPLRLNFGVYPSDRATVMYRKFTPVLEAIQIPLENQLGREVDIHLKIFENYETGLESLAKGEVDFVRFGPASYILAEQKNKDIRLLAMELRKGLKRFNGLIITRADSGINSIEDLRGRSFAFGDVNSTIGTFLSQSLLLKHGINEEALSHFDHLDRHDLVARSVINGNHDAGALKTSTYKKLCDPEEVVVIEAFENVTKPWVASSKLPKEVCNAITQSLLMLEDPEVISELGCSGFAESNSEEYDLIREGMKHATGFKKAPDEEE